MNDCWIICESQVAADLLKTLLPAEVVQPEKIFISHAKSSGVSMARTLLLRPAVSVLLVEDADTLNEAAIDERLDFISWALTLVSSPERFDVFLFRPEVEAVFFQSADFLALCGKSLSEMELKVARRAPKLALSDLGLNADVIHQAGPQGLLLLKQSPLIGELLAKVRNLNASQAAHSA